MNTGCVRSFGNTPTYANLIFHYR